MISISKKLGKNRKGKLVVLVFAIVTLLSIALLSGCTEKQTGLKIVVVGRDSTSGTREFFWEHVMAKENFTYMLQEKNSNGAVYETVKQTPGAIGYVGLGYLMPGVKVVKIEDVTPSKENVLSGAYPLSRELYLFTKGETSGLAMEFIEYVLSREGQKIVEEEGFVPIANVESYNSSGKSLSGKLTISGSTTVFPIIEKAKDEFLKIYPQVSITVSSTGSGAGINALIGGTVDIAMSSRDLKSSEADKGLVKYVIAKDGIAIIVNPENIYIDNLSMSQLKAIYKGEITNWEELKSS